MHPPTRTFDLCAEQRGVIARWQLRDALGAHRADDLLRSGWFSRLLRGVYRLHGSPTDPLQPAIAAALRCGQGATLTGPAALSLLNLEGVALGPGYAIALPPGRRLASLPFPTHRDPDPGSATTCLGAVRLAAPVDALLVTAARFDVPGRQLRLTHDRLRWEGLLRPGDLRRRAAALRLSAELAGGELLAMDDDPSIGDQERGLGELLRRFEPAPRPQVWVTPHRRVDFLFDAALLAIEYQGRLDHDGPDARSRDRIRDDELRLAGIRCLYVSAVDLAEPRTLLSRIAAALTSRADELGVATPRLLPR